MSLDYFMCYVFHCLLTFLGFFFTVIPLSYFSAWKDCHYVKLALGFSSVPIALHMISELEMNLLYVSFIDCYELNYTTVNMYEFLESPYNVAVELHFPYCRVYQWFAVLLSCHSLRVRKGSVRKSRPLVYWSACLSCRQNSFLFPSIKNMF